MLARRSFLAAIGSSAAFASLPARAREPFTIVDLRGAIDATSDGVRAGAADDQGAMITRLLARAAAAGKPLFLPPGTYFVSDLELADGARLMGVPGASRLVYSGHGRMLFSNSAGTASLSGLVVDGANRWLAEETGGMVDLRGVERLDIDDCELIGSFGNAVALERCGGRITRSRLSGAAGVGLYAVESTGLSVTDNHVLDCANGGILIHRWQTGPDNSIVTGNRIERIGASDGGTGQNGNGINVFRAANVMVANNHITDCAFSAIRSNSGSNVQIVGNQCLNSGETALYSEFSFEGAIVASNLIDGAAKGISIANFNEGGRLATVANNVIRNIAAPLPYSPDEPKLGIAAEADTVITGNVIEAVSDWGIMVGWGPYLRNVSVTGNIVRDVPVGVAVSVVEDAQQALIADNVIQGASGGAVVGFRWGEPATADLTSGDNRHAHLTVKGNRTA
ncbi:TIGR03808 family TAT-translocated repetitive protein [Pararhizobium haloflavum]|uniref:TIGR03808 family TAT-translocated repetitive protein n=1 Tax=Pararhizobium haloflavum TaxID=2037914 RepID=UPI000C19C7FD